MRGKLVQPQLWESTKYISWPHTHDQPIVRIPRPSGTPESKTVRRKPGEQERELFDRCVSYRDQRGPEVWGEKRWHELLNVPRRSVAKHRRQQVGPMTGVFPYERPSGTTEWIATWYEQRADGTRRKRSKQYSYGTPSSRYSTSQQAKAAAIQKRQKEEARWYTTSGHGERRQANRLEKLDG